MEIAYINDGVPPVEAEDPEVAPLIERCVKKKRTLVAPYTCEALTLADVVVDVQCDYHKTSLGRVEDGYADIKALEESLRIVGEKIQPECLVLIETTVPPGTTEYIAYPIMKRAFEKRGFTNPDRGSEGTACRKMGGWGFGPIGRSWVLRMKYSRSRPGHQH